MYNFQQVNRYLRDNPDLLTKALTSATGIGGAFSPESLEQLITDTVNALIPEIAIMTPKSIASTTHRYIKKTSNPGPGGAQGESATTPISNTKNTSTTVNLKIIKRKGAVTDFINSASREFFDAGAYEMQGQLKAQALDLRNYITYGNADGNAYEFDGLDKLIQTNRVANYNGKFTDLSVLDDMIDNYIRLEGNGQKAAFGMSPEMLSSISRLETTVRKDIAVNGNMWGQVEIPGGWRLTTYRGFPIITTTATRPIEKMRPTVTVAGDAGGGATAGALSNGTYYVQVAPITTEGEQLASTEASVTLSGGTAVQRIKITLSVGHKNAAGNYNVYAYKIYCSQTSGAEVLVKYVSAFLYDSNGQIVDGSGNGTQDPYNGITGNDIYINSLTPGLDVPTALQADVPYNSVNGVYPETIYFWDVDPIQGLGKIVYTNQGGSAFNGLITTEELAKIDSYRQFLLQSFCTLVPAYEKTSYWVRGVRPK